ncbi:MAG: hypothetical protein R3Y56_07275 [Akkermansia sp.]
MSDVIFTFSGDASSLQAALNDIKGAITSTQQSASGLANVITAAFAATAASVAGSFVAINAAAQRETLSTAFIPLLGSAEAAQERMAELAQFAASTPFQINEIAAASKTLETLTAGALSTGDGLRLVGDIAASTNTPFAEIAVTVGRLYAGLDSGRPVGEAMARLQELGAISPSVRAQLESMQKAGQKGSAVWAAAAQDLNKFKDSMSLQSATWAGKVSTMADAWDELLVKIGQPLMVALTPAMDAITKTLADLSTQASSFGEGVATVFTGLAAGFTQLVELIVPVVSAIQEFVSFLGGAKTVIASVATAMLIYGTNTQAATKDTISFTAAMAKMTATLKGFSLTALVSRFKTGFASLLSTARASTFGLRTLWSMTMGTMAAVTRTAMVAIKSAFISTGVGLLIVGIGEALGALYSWWQGNEEAARQAAEATKEYRNALQDIEKQASKVETNDQADAVINNVHKQWLEAQSQWYQAMMDGEDELAAAHAQAMSDLYARKEEYMKTLPLQVKAAEAAKAEAAAIEQQNQALRKLKQESEEATAQLRKLHAEQEAKVREKQLSSIEDASRQSQLRLADLGLSDIAQLNEELETLYAKATTYVHGITPEELERYKQLVSTKETILELEMKSAEQKRKQQEEEEAAKMEYDDKVAMLKAEITQNDKKIAQLKEEQRIVQLTAQYRAQGLNAAEARAKNMVKLEKQAAAAAAAREAKRSRLEKLLQQDHSRMDGAYISDSKAAVGGGGNSVLVGGPMLTESKKHSKLLTDIKTAVKTPPVITVLGNVQAVIGD